MILHKTTTAIVLKLFLKLVLFGLLIATSRVSVAALPWAVEGEPLPSLAPMLEKIQPAVVNLSTTTTTVTRQPSFESPLLRDPFFQRFFDFPSRPRSRSSSSLGSGVIVDAKNGYVITNHHLIDEADEITVTTHDGRALQAELVGSDADSDVAVIKIDAAQLSEIPLGNSAALRVGDFVVAIGNPFGLSQTVTSGIVSALGRSDLGIEGYEDFIQTDASINPGNSGGALVDLRGRLIGINTAIFSRGGGSVGIGFAIPVDMVKELMAQLVEHGNIKRGLLGVTMQDLTPSLADAFSLSGKKGAIISRVLPNTAAEKAGMKEGDIVIRFNKTPIEDSTDLRNAIGLLRVGATATLQLYRDRKLKTVTAQIEADPRLSATASTLSGRLVGGQFKSVAPTEYHNGGVEVTELKSGSPAARSGLIKKDLILAINRRPVKTPDELEEAVKSSDGTLLIKLLRGRRIQFLVLR